MLTHTKPRSVCLAFDVYQVVLDNSKACSEQRSKRTAYIILLNGKIYA